MKKALIQLFSASVFLLFISSEIANGQGVPQGINYQAIARNVTGTVVVNASIAVRASILDNSPNGTMVYSEKFSVVTNQYGLFTMAIGRGTVISGVFNTIDWGGSSKWLKIEIDITNTGNFVLVGTSELLSVPYALFAASGTPGPTGPSGPAGPMGPIGSLSTYSSTSNDNDPSIGGCGSPNATVVVGPIALPDVSVTNINFVVSGLLGNICSVTFTVDSLTHTWDADLTLTLTSPGGTSVIMSANNGGSSDNYIHTTFDDAAGTPITGGAAPFNGTFSPENPLSAFNGVSPNGTWIFTSSDGAGGDFGTFYQGTLNIATDIATYTFVTEVNVPVNAGETTLIDADYSAKSTNNSNVFMMVSRDISSGGGSIGTPIGYGANTARATNKFVFLGVNERETGLATGNYYYKLWRMSSPVAGSENYSIIVTKH